MPPMPARPMSQCFAAAIWSEAKDSLQLRSQPRHYDTLTWWLIGFVFKGSPVAEAIGLMMSGHEVLGRSIGGVGRPYQGSWGVACLVWDGIWVCVYINI